jgi:hypothetical protein
VLIMKVSKITLALITAVTLSGCATAVPVVDFYDTDSDALSRFQNITVLDGASTDANGMKSLGEVSGIYCEKSNGQVAEDDHLAEAQAIDQVKLKAAKLGAHYMTKPQCVISNSGDVANNCYATLVCTSSALRLD